MSWGSDERKEIRPTVEWLPGPKQTMVVAQPDMAMAWVDPWVGLGPEFFMQIGLGWVEFNQI